MAVANPYARTKQTVLSAIHFYLYHDIAGVMNDKEKVIVIKNSVLMKYGHMSCSYKGKQFICDLGYPPKGKVQRLSPELHAEMDALIKEKEQIFTYESAYVMGYVTQALNVAKCLGDVLDLLPESVHKPITDRMATPRSNNTPRLPPDIISAFLLKNAKAIDMMKTRMVLNLLT